MERLTERLENGGINVKYASQHETAIHRLVTIEDILGDDYDLDRLRALTKADREERIFISPVKIGDTVYYITGLYGNLVKPVTVEEVYFGNSTLALGVSTGFAKFPILEKHYFITKEAAEDALQHMQMEE